MKTQISDLYSKFIKSSGVSTDTRSIKHDSIFFALKGDHFDGNQFADEALKKGAQIAVIDDSAQSGHQKMVVDDALKTLQDLANYHRNYIKVPIIAITGSNGKTTTKKLVKDVLSQKFNVKATSGNLNNHIGIPLTLLSFTSNLDIGIVEMGANHQKEIQGYCEIAEPNYGYITNYGKAHLEGFGGIEGVIKGKSELYDYLIEHDGLIFFNRDDKIQVEKAIEHKNYSIGQHTLADCKVSFVKADPYVQIQYEDLNITSQLIGEYNFKNIAAAIGIGRYFGVDKSKIKKAIEDFETEDMRSQIIDKKDAKIFMDAYNANPTSMEAALKSFKAMGGEHQIVILGDMFEIGENTLKEHTKILELCQELDFNTVMVCGTHFSKAAKQNTFAKSFENTKALKDFLSDYKLPSSAFIMIKGSRGMQLESILDEL